ncbi:MAG: BspA family leucine-rich repeat surface protein [Mangrovibacterium sp.]
MRYQLIMSQSRITSLAGVRESAHAHFPHIGYWLGLFLMIFLFGSCQNDLGTPDDSGGSGGSSTVQFSILVDAPQEMKVKSTASEDVINNIDILMYDKTGTNGYLGRVSVNNADITSETVAGKLKYTFLAELESTGASIRLFVIANGRDKDDNSDLVNFSDLTQGMSEATMRSTLRLPTLQAPTMTLSSYSDLDQMDDLEGQLLPHVMWGQADLSDMTDGALPEVTLIRAMASVVIRWDDNNVDLKILGITAVHAASDGYVFPHADWVNYPSAGTKNPMHAIAGNLDYAPFDDIPYTPYACDGNAISEQRGYWEYDETGDLSYPAFGPLYIYPSPGYPYSTSAEQGVSFIIVADAYDKRCYYRVAPEYVDAYGYPTGPVDFVRNHKYILTVTRVDGPGYNSMQGAYNNPPGNLTIVVEEDDAEYDNYVTDGTNMIATTVNSVHAYISDSYDIANPYVSQEPLFEVKSKAPSVFEISFPDPSDSNVESWDFCHTSSGWSSTSLKSGVALNYQKKAGAVAKESVIQISGNGGVMNLEVSFTHNPNRTMTNGNSFDLPLNEDSFDSWELILPDDFPTDYVDIIRNGATALTNRHYQGTATSSISFLARAECDEMPTASFHHIIFKGVDSSGEMEIRKVFLQVGETRPFRSTWEIPSGGAIVKLPIKSLSGNYKGEYYCTVDWGDGNTDLLTPANALTLEHIYSVGTYEVVITGKFKGFDFSDGVQTYHLKEINEWGCAEFTNNGLQFYNSGIRSMKTTDAPNLAGITNMASWFLKAADFTGEGIEHWDVSKVENMHGMFYYAQQFNVDLSAWDVRRVTTMKLMFNEAKAFNNGDLGNNSANPLSWGSKTSRVTNMTGMFERTPFNQDISGWNVSAVTEMYAMFSDATLFNQDLSDWDVSSVIDATDFDSEATAWEDSKKPSF